MNPNHIDKLAAAETTPNWLPWVLLAVFAVGFLGSLAMYLRWKRRDYWRDAELIPAGFDSIAFCVGAEAVLDVLKRWAHLTSKVPGHAVWIRFAGPTGYDNELRKALKPGQSIDDISGTVSGPRHEYGARWVTRLLGGQTDVYTVTVRDRADDPSGARALAHELGAHLWPKLRGEGWNLDHSNEKAAEIAADLEGMLG